MPTGTEAVDKFEDKQTNLTAMFLNNVSVAVTVAGTLVPSFSVFYGTMALTNQQADFVKLSAPLF